MPPPTTDRLPVITRFRHWLQNWVRARSTLSELEQSGTGETARMAHDLGMSSAELVKLAGRGPGAADLMRQRLAQLHIDEGQLARSEPEVLRDMQRLCSTCRVHGRCARDLAHNPDDAAWRDYCPNVPTIDALRNP
jgi:hypothetical protein